MEKTKATGPTPTVGDHIFVPRSICYSHHGIYIGKDKVIHYQTPMENGEPDPKSCRVIESDMRTFLGDDTNWYLFRYGINDEYAKLYPKGTFTTKNCDDPQLVVKRARQALKDGFSHYNIVGNNCEDFANFCKTGQRSMESTQFSEALERVAVARCAMANGYRSPLVYAGCVMGLFTLKDFKNQPVNHIPTTADFDSEESNCTDEENKENNGNILAKDKEIKEKIATDIAKTNSNANIDSIKDEIDSSPTSSILMKNQDSALTSRNDSCSNGGPRKKVNFNIPADTIQYE